MIAKPKTTTWALAAGMLAGGLLASCCPEPQCPQPGGAAYEEEEAPVPQRPEPFAVEAFFQDAYSQVMACVQLSQEPPIAPVQCEGVVHGSDASVTDVTVTSGRGPEVDACIKRVLETRSFPHVFRDESAPLFFVYVLD